ncbi:MULTISPECIES: hypothetical protein [unclassified Mesorhizobium]|uniref:hypothetical protein n=1 Tax=unclassified Mesorhizobium TaxID=325217 RepID=UPI0010F80F05|nr:MULTISPECIES: hypothetical protein [unclassified Mesorhizobium]
MMSLAACAGGPKPSAPAGADIAIMDDLPINGIIMSRVSAVVCAKGPFDTAPPSTDALNALKQQAAAINANGIYRVKYVTTGLVDRCMVLPGTGATGIAYRNGPAAQ